MVRYDQVVAVCNKAQDLIQRYNSDVRVEILKHSYPYVLQIQLMAQKHTFRVIRKWNLKYFLKILYRYLQVQ